VFEARAAVLEHTDRALANYLRQTRTWSERLQQCRNDIEHKGWILPSITYSRSDDTIKVNEPSISGQPVTEFVAFVFDRLSCFVEELTVYCLQREMPPEVTIAEIASAQRLKEAPERFRVTLVRGGLPVWQIAYHHSAFEEA
jgi:hypothetical protein